MQREKYTSVHHFDIVFYMARDSILQRFKVDFKPDLSHGDASLQTIYLAQIRQ